MHTYYVYINIYIYIPTFLQMFTRNNLVIVITSNIHTVLLITKNTTLNQESHKNPGSMEKWLSLDLGHIYVLSLTQLNCRDDVQGAKRTNWKGFHWPNMETLNINKEHNSISNTSVHLNTQSGNCTLKFSWLNIGEEYRTNHYLKI